MFYESIECWIFYLKVNVKCIFKIFNIDILGKSKVKIFFDWLKGNFYNI